MTFTSTTGKPSAPPCSSVSITPFSTAGMKLRGITPPTIASTNSSPRHARSARPAATRPRTGRGRRVCFLSRPSASAVPRDRLAVGDVHVVGLDLDAELARRASRARSRGGSRPCRAARVWCVSGLRSIRSTGSSSWRRCSTFASLSSSALILAWIATASSGSGVGQRVDVDGAPFGASTSPVAVSRELRDRGDVARRDLVDRFLLLAPHREELVHPLVGLRARVGQARRRA